MSSKAQPENRTLPNKEQTLFRQLVKHYETKQYKKGIKAADSILKKFPEHGETLAMKGLLLNCMEKKEEAYELVKRGVKNDLRSHVCWHVYGLLYRSDREYDEAIKCYKNALRMDKENLQVLRDLALLQVQMRDLPGFLTSRQQLLELKSNNKQNWVSFALAHHLCGHHEVAAKVLDAYIGTMDEEVHPSEAYEHSELLMYKAQILGEGGFHAEALAVLDTADAQNQIKDRLGLLEARGLHYLAMQRLEDAESIYRRLISIIPDNQRYHFGLLKALRLAPPHHTASPADTAGIAPVDATSALAPDFSQLLPEQLNKLQALYEELAGLYPHSAACKRIPLDFLEGEVFVRAADGYVRRYVQKGIPSLFTDLKPLYQNPTKRNALGELFSGLEKAHEGEERAADAEAAAAANEGGIAAAGDHPQHGKHGRYASRPLLWVRLYLAQHHDHLRHTEEALKYVDACLKMNPSLIEAHSVRARVLRHAGDLAGAAHAADTARGMDLSDRYLNCLAVKAYFRAGNVDEAERLAALFTRDGEQANNLFDMQAMWYEIHSGRAFLEKKDYGRALKRFLKVDSHFDDFVEDQFDFHSYCVRKQTMRAYVDMLRMEDKLLAHPTYSKAMSGAIRAYLDLFDHPPKSAEEKEQELLAGMTPEEQKKYRQKKRKEEQRRQKEAADAQAADAVAAAKKGGGEVKKRDPDPDGVQLAMTTNPLGQAAKLVKRLVSHAGENLETHLLAFEVYIRKAKYLLALQAVQQALHLAGASHPSVHMMLLRLAQQVQQLSVSGTARDAAAAATRASHPIVVEMAQEGVCEALGGLSPQEYHQRWAEIHTNDGTRDNLPQQAASVQGNALLLPDKTAAAVRMLMQAGPGKGSHAECIAVHRMLRDDLQDGAAAEHWREKCRSVFQWSRYFGGTKVSLQKDVHVNGTASVMAELTVS